MLGLLRQEEGGYYNGLLALFGDEVGWYYKWWLVFFGEFFLVLFYVCSWMWLMSLIYVDMMFGVED
jgi:hypothetical protein